jgi:hypothetical protein
MKIIPKETALKEVNISSRASTYGYYKDAGWNLLTELIPPEAK